MQKTKNGKLYQAKDKNKDQTYFLYRVNKSALDKTLFPLGDLTKPEVRQLAKKFKLVTANKKESMGICFVGKVGIKEFITQYVETEPGLVFDQNGIRVGEHEGAIFYTIGQRHGLSIGGGMPYYVIGKDMGKNIVYVTTDLQDKRLWNNEITFTSAHWISDQPNSQKNIMVRTRHRAELIKVKKIEKVGEHNWRAILAKDIRALTPGQSAVFYLGQECIGGGVVV